MNARPLWRGPGRQRGAIAALVVISLVAMLGIVGLALDGSHGMLNKSRLQNVVDAAALGAAQLLDLSAGDETVARAEALSMFNLNANETGNAEIRSAFSGGDLNVTVEFSATLDPFSPGTTPAEYVRVTATDLNLPSWFISVLGFADKPVAASAVAGPSPTLNEICNVVPMMVCGDSSATDGLWGYTAGEVEVLKSSSNGGEFEVGPGNFQLVRLEGSQGGADIRTGLAGSYDSCLLPDDDTIPTEPGNTVGPVAQGLNTRLGNYAGPVSRSREDYPPDLVLDQISPLSYDEGQILYQGAPISADNPLPWGYEQYMTEMFTPNLWNDYDSDGVPLRRVLRLPVGDCDGTTNGQGNVPLLGVLCFFLLQEVSQQGNDAEVFGQFMGAQDTCTVNGKPGPVPGADPGPYRIQLYKDPDWDSA